VSFVKLVKVDNGEKGSATPEAGFQETFQSLGSQYRSLKGFEG
jgi:hypothetical protein